MEYKFYVYAYLREDGTPFYIGKGQGNRITHRGNKYDIRPGGNIAVKLHENLSHEDALAIEASLIKKYGRIDNGTGILRNRTDGGTGSAGWVASDELRKKMSDTRRGRPNPKVAEALRGRKLSPECRAKMSASQRGIKKPSVSKAHTKYIYYTCDGRKWNAADIKTAGYNLGAITYGIQHNKMRYGMKWRREPIDPLLETF